MNNTIPKFDAQTWFNQFTEEGSSIVQDDLQPVLEFTLIWNLFERFVCQNVANLSRIRAHIEGAINAGKITSEDFLPHLEFFRTRYENPTEEYLKEVLLSAHHHQSTKDRENIRTVQLVLDGSYTDVNNVVYALFFIAYRVRNNLFHGEKQLHTLHLQSELFETVNSYLSLYMGKTLDLSRLLKVTS